MAGKRNPTITEPESTAWEPVPAKDEWQPRWAVVCVLVVPVLLWVACCPFTSSAVNDDFSYAFTVRQLLETGQLRYNGWSSPIVGLQAYWGALFAKLLGFSNNVLRLSMLPISIGCSALTYSLHRRVGLGVRASLFATLLLIGSPLFTSWSVSFMTDIPGFFFTLLLFHFTITAMRSRSAIGAIASAAATSAAGWVGGSIRQSLLPLGCAALFVAILRHRRQPVALSGTLVIGLVYVAACVLLLQWQEQQPYTLQELWPSWNQAPTGFLLMLGLLLQLCLFLIPLAPVWLRWGGVGRWTVAAAAVCMVAIAFIVHALAPDSLAARFLQGLWVGDTLTPTGLLASNVDTPGERPVVFSNPVRLHIGAAVFWQIALAVVVLCRHRNNLADALRRLRNQAWSDRAWICFGFATICATYVTLLMPRAALRVVFDRYLLVAFPIVTIAVLSLAQRSKADLRVPKSAWAALLILTLLGVATTFDHFVELRAREQLAERLISAGVPRTKFSNGLAYDGWTQLLATGYMNNPLIVNPPGAVVDSLKLRRNSTLYPFLRFTPAIDPDYIILNWPSDPSLPEGLQIRVVPTLLPPFKRWLVVWPVDLAPETPRDRADNPPGSPGN